MCCMSNPFGLVSAEEYPVTPHGPGCLPRIYPILQGYSDLGVVKPAAMLARVMATGPFRLVGLVVAQFDAAWHAEDCMLFAAHGGRRNSTHSLACLGHQLVCCTCCAAASSCQSESLISKKSAKCNSDKDGGNIWRDI